MERQTLLERIKTRLNKLHHPRWLMSGMLILTGAVGFLSSVLLVRLGLEAMAIRYPIAILVAYLAFLMMVWLWVQRQLDKNQPSEPEQASANKRGKRSLFHSTPDISFGGSGGSSSASDFRPGGGDFGGAGAQAAWAPVNPVAMQNAPVITQNVSSSGSSSSSGGGWDLDLGEGAIVLVIIAILVAVLGGAVFYFVIVAPSFFAEILLDALIMSGVYRTMKDTHPANWFWTLLRKTWIPLLVLLVVFGVGGYYIQEAMPQAHTLGEAFRAAMAESS